LAARFFHLDRWFLISPSPPPPSLS
jgi:hypothetical protein